MTSEHSHRYPLVVTGTGHPEVRKFNTIYQYFKVPYHDMAHA